MSDKARIVAETLIRGAMVSEVARRWHVSSQQVFTWRREARAKQLALASETEAGEPSFVPIVADDASLPQGGSGFEAARSGAAIPAPEHYIEISLAGAVIRVSRGTDCAWLAKVLRALRASAA